MCTSSSAAALSEVCRAGSVRGRPDARQKPYRRVLDEPIDVAGMFRLDDSVAIVTGASSGLGRRFARVLHAAGAAVVVAARRAAHLEALVAANERMLAVPADISVEDDRGPLGRGGPGWPRRRSTLDVLVNNAGIGRTIPALDETLERFQQVLDVNLTSLFRLSQLAARTSSGTGGGAIVNIASMLGWSPRRPSPRRATWHQERRGRA